MTNAVFRIGAILIVAVLMVEPAVRGDDALSPVEQVKRAADEIERLRNLRWRLPEGEVDEDLNRQLSAAEADERAILKQLRDQVSEAKRLGRDEEAKRLSQLFREAAQATDYFRAHRESRTAAGLAVVISEVCYWPGQGESEWIELANISDGPVDVSGWALLDGQALRFIMPHKFPLVPTNGHVVIRFDGTGEVFSPFDKDGKAEVHSPIGMSGDVLGNGGGHLALYSSGDHGPVPGISTIQSYVAWGLSPGIILHHALVSGRWKGLTDVPYACEPMPFGATGAYWMQRGGSMGVRLPSRSGEVPDSTSWVTFSPSETSPGKSNAAVRRAPLQHLPPDGDPVFIGEKTKLRCLGLPGGAKYDFQVYLDEDCTRVYAQSEENDTGLYSFVPDLPQGSSLYWRVRAVYQDGSASAWSDIRRLVCKRK